MYLLSTVSICFCWNFPLIISCCVPSNDALNVKHYNITICVVILYIAHLVPNSTSRKFIKCFGCLCRLQRKYVVRRNSCKQEMYQIIIIVLPSNHGGFAIHTQKYISLRTNDITHSYSINKWIPGTTCFWYSRGVPKVCILVAQVCTYSRQISVKLTKDVFFAPTRTTWGGFITSFFLCPLA